MNVKTPEQRKAARDKRFQAMSNQALERAIQSYREDLSRMSDGHGFEVCRLARIERLAWVEADCLKKQDRPNGEATKQRIAASAQLSQLTHGMGDVAYMKANSLRFGVEEQQRRKLLPGTEAMTASFERWEQRVEEQERSATSQVEEDPSQVLFEKLRQEQLRRSATPGEGVEPEMSELLAQIELNEKLLSEREATVTSLVTAAKGALEAFENISRTLTNKPGKKLESIYQGLDQAGLDIFQVTSSLNALQTAVDIISR